MSASEYTILGKRISRYEYFLFDCCDALHGSVCGTGDRLPACRALELYSFILCRLSDWHKSTPSTQAYDDTVKKLCEMARNEYVASKHLEQDMNDYEDEIIKSKTILSVDLKKCTSSIIFPPP